MRRSLATNDFQMSPSSNIRRTPLGRLGCLSCRRILPCSRLAERSSIILRPRRGGTAYDLYAAFDPATHRLLILEKHFAWEVSSLTSAPVPPYKLATMPLSHISTDMGFSIGSAEGSIIRRLGNGLIRRRGDQTIRIYDSDTGCETSTFAFRRHSVVGVWSLTGGC